VTSFSSEFHGPSEFYRIMLVFEAGTSRLAWKGQEVKLKHTRGSAS